MTRPIDPYARKQKWCFRGKSPSGATLCFCGCGLEVPKGRQSSASKECADWYNERSNMNRIRWRVEQRDKGVCANCGFDTNKFQSRIYKIAHRIGGRQSLWSPEIIWYLSNWKAERVRAILRRHGWPREFRRWWEADHIVPVVEGGGGCDFSGYRTLCVPCHKRETAELAARRAARRRNGALTPPAEAPASQA